MVYQNYMGRDFLRGVFGESEDFFGDTSSCVLLGHLPSSFWLRSLVSTVVDFWLNWFVQYKFHLRQWTRCQCKGGVKEGATCVPAC